MSAHIFSSKHAKIIAAAVIAAAIAAALVLFYPSRVRAQTDLPPAISGVSPSVSLSGDTHDAPMGKLDAPLPNNAACQTQMSGGGASLSIDVKDEFGPYRGDQVTMLSDANGLPLATIACGGAASTFRVLPGSYRMESFVGDAHSQVVAVNVPARGAHVSLMLQRAANQPAGSSIVD